MSKPHAKHNTRSKDITKIGQIFSRNLFCMVSHHRTGHTKTKLSYMSYPRYQIQRHRI